MKILLLGSGGTRTCLCLKMKQSPLSEALYIAPGNAGTVLVRMNVPLHPNDFEAVGAFALKEAIDMVVVVPEEPLVRGIYDHFKADEQLKGIHVIARRKRQLEGSKALP